MPIQIWHQLRERLTDSFHQIINSFIESFAVKLIWLGCIRWILFDLLFYLQYQPVQTDAPATGAAKIGGLNFSCLFQKAEIQIPVNKIWMSTKAELFPGESILRFIHQSQNRKLFASWHYNYNQSEAVPNIPGKREHDYRRCFTCVSSPDFSWGWGDVSHRLWRCSSWKLSSKAKIAWDF